MKINYFSATSKNGLSKMKIYLKNFLEFSADTFIISCYYGFN